MALFLSTYTNKIDKKGRISVPAPFRNVLAQSSFQGIIAYSSFVHACVEASSIERIERLSESIDSLDPYSEVRDAFATAILGGSQQLSFDGEGRVMLSESLIEVAEIKEKATFVGKGQTFEIWNPESLHEYADKAKLMAKEMRGSLALSPRPSGGGHAS